MNGFKAEHIIWDWNGTLYNDASACVATLNIILERRGMSGVTLEQYMDIFRFPVKEYYEILGFDFSREDWDGMAREFHEIYARESGRMRLREGVIDVLEILRGRGVPMSVLSASEIGVLDRLLSFYGIRGFFQRVSGLSDIYAGSKVEAGRHLVSELDADSGDIIIIGDTTHDYDVAEDLGCRCILLTGGHQSESRLRQCGCVVLDDPRDIPAAISSL